MTVIPQLAIRENEDSHIGWNRLEVYRARGSKHRYDRRLLLYTYQHSLNDIVTSKLDRWIDETSWYSSISSMTRHPLFVEIVGTPGAENVILEKMQQGDIRLHWFPVLQDIAKTDPVPDHSRGHLQEMADAWLKWAHSDR